MKKIGIPRRSRICTKTKEKLAPGSEYVSVIREGDEEGEFLREDVSIGYWNEHGAELLEGCKSHWRGRMPLKVEVKEPEELMSRAFEMFEAALGEPEGELTAFVLALFLARKKVLVLRQEMEHYGRLHYLFEVKEGEEVFSVPILHPTEEEIARVQGELASGIAS